MKRLIPTALAIGALASTALAEVSYQTFNYPDAEGGSTFLTGIRGISSGGPTDVFMTGVFTPQSSSSTQGLLYQGPIAQNTGIWSVVNFPSAAGLTVTSTALYGPNDLGGGNVRAVGSYKTQETGARDIGLLYEGPLNGSGTWQTLNAAALDPNTINTIAHSTHGSLVVGNYDTTLVTGRAFIHDPTADQWWNFNPVSATSITAYGIWHNGGSSYTITGGFSLNPSPTTLDQGYVADFDSITQQVTNWTAYNFDNLPIADVVSHFDGITGDGEGGYHLTGDYIGIGAENGLAFYASIRRELDGSFSPASWTQISYPSDGGLTVNVTSGNSVFENYVIGIYTANDTGVAQGYVALVPEPATALLTLAACAALLTLHRRRRGVGP